MLNLFTLLVFLFVFVGVYTVRALSRKRLREEAVAERLNKLKALVEQEAPEQVAEADESVVLAGDNYTGRFPRIWRACNRFMKNLETLGWKKNLRVRVMGTGAASLAGAALIARMTPAPVLVTIFGGLLLFGVIGGVAYHRAMSKFLDELSRALPEAIDSIARICRSGVPVQSSFAIAAEHLHGPLSDELLSLDHWLKLGIPLRQVLQESAQRVPLREYRFFAVILIISQESGGRLADTLERLAATLRSRAELAMKVQAKTSEARASIKIVALLVPGVLAYMYINAPKDFNFMFSDPAGLKVLLYVAVSVLSGLAITYVMVRRIR